MIGLSRTIASIQSSENHLSGLYSTVSRRIDTAVCPSLLKRNAVEDDARKEVPAQPLNVQLSVWYCAAWGWPLAQPVAEPAGLRDGNRAPRWITREHTAAL